MSRKVSVVKLFSKDGMDVFYPESSESFYLEYGSVNQRSS